jgi:hypothetical protein
MYGDEHFTYFTPETIRKMVRLSGFEVIRVETHGLGRCFLGPGKDEASADSLGAAYDRSRHHRGVIFAERVLDRLLDLIQAGQVIHLYARRREPKAPEPLRGPRARPGRRGSRQRGLFS